MNTSPLIAALLLAITSVGARADDDACRKILDASVRTGVGAQKTTSGYDFTMDAPALYAFGRHSCAYLHDETADGQPAVVYRERYIGSTGSTIATIWISTSSGRLLREEQDGDIRGKGQGHVSYRWPPRP